MNERIWELASKSGFDVSADGKFGNYSQMYKIEKFAELIVKECMNICEQQRLEILNNPNDPSWTEHLAECQTTMEQTFLRS